MNCGNKIVIIIQHSVICLSKADSVNSYYLGLQELEKPPPDPLHGLRIHSWVLVLEGKREVPESFFVEPFTGIAHPLTSENYLGIESLWNHQNYWVNMQDCSAGVKVNFSYSHKNILHCWTYTISTGFNFFVSALRKAFIGII